MRIKPRAQATGADRFGCISEWGLTLIDVLILVATVAMALAVTPILLPRKGCKGSARSSCVSNLKQIGLAHRMFANDHGDQFPWQVSTNEGGSREHAMSAEVYRHFETESNELNTPKILSCPADRARTRQADWRLFNNSSLSYFAGLDAKEASSELWLSGDRNVVGGISTSSAVRSIARNSTVVWAAMVHTNAGNVGFADGSVQQLTSSGLQLSLQSNTLSVIRLAIP